MHPKNVTSNFPNITPITVKAVIIIVVTLVANPSIPSVKFTAFVVPNNTNIANGIYNHIGILINCFIIGIYVSVPFGTNFTIYIVYNTAIINNPIILYIGFKPFVFFKTNFLKSSTNPTNPKPNVTNINANISLKF